VHPVFCGEAQIEGLELLDVVLEVRAGAFVGQFAGFDAVGQGDVEIVVAAGVGAVLGQNAESPDANVAVPGGQSVRLVDIADEVEHVVGVNGDVLLVEQPVPGGGGRHTDGLLHRIAVARHPVGQGEIGQAGVIVGVVGEPALVESVRVARRVAQHPVAHLLGADDDAAAGDADGGIRREADFSVQVDAEEDRRGAHAYQMLVVAEAAGDQVRCGASGRQLDGDRADERLFHKIDVRAAGAAQQIAGFLDVVARFGVIALQIGLCGEAGRLFEIVGGGPLVGFVGKERVGPIQDAPCVVELEDVVDAVAVLILELVPALAVGAAPEAVIETERRHRHRDVEGDGIFAGCAEQVLRDVADAHLGQPAVGVLLRVADALVLHPDRERVVCLDANQRLPEGVVARRNVEGMPVNQHIQHIAAARCRVRQAHLENVAARAQRGGRVERGPIRVAGQARLAHLELQSRVGIDDVPAVDEFAQLERGKRGAVEGGQMRVAEGFADRGRRQRRRPMDAGPAKGAFPMSGAEPEPPGEAAAGDRTGRLEGAELQGRQGVAVALGVNQLRRLGAVGVAPVDDDLFSGQRGQVHVEDGGELGLGEGKQFVRAVLGRRPRPFPVILVFGRGSHDFEAIFFFAAGGQRVCRVRQFPFEGSGRRFLFHLNCRRASRFGRWGDVGCTGWGGRAGRSGRTGLGRRACRCLGGGWGRRLGGS